MARLIKNELKLHTPLLLSNQQSLLSLVVIPQRMLIGSLWFRPQMYSSQIHLPCKVIFKSNTFQTVTLTKSKPLQMHVDSNFDK